MTNPPHSPQSPGFQPDGDPTDGTPFTDEQGPAAATPSAARSGQDDLGDIRTAPERIPGREPAVSEDRPADSQNLPERTSGDKPGKKQKKRQHQSVKGSVAGGTWAALIIGALVLILLLVFILQNQTEVQLVFFGWEWNFPIGVGMLIAAIAGALIMAMVGIVRMAQLRRQIKRGYK